MALGSSASLVCSCATSIPPVQAAVAEGGLRCHACCCALANGVGGAAAAATDDATQVGQEIMCLLTARIEICNRSIAHLFRLAMTE